MPDDDEVLTPDWPAPPGVRAFVTLRGHRGASAGPWGQVGGGAGGLNLGAHCGDDPKAVVANRQRLRSWLPAEPAWLDQVHGTDVVDLDAIEVDAGTPLRADAAVTRRRGRPLVVMTADCLPVLFCDRAGSVIGIAHAGWRGLAAGVLERTLDVMRCKAPVSSEWFAWLGPAIGPACFEVGPDVFDVFVGRDPAARSAFRPALQPGKWLADLPMLARMRLRRAGVDSVHGGDLCTVSDPQRFYSFRRDGVTGRCATLVWRESD